MYGASLILSFSLSILMITTDYSDKPKVLHNVLREFLLLPCESRYVFFLFCILSCPDLEAGSVCTPVHRPLVYFSKKKKIKIKNKKHGGPRFSGRASRSILHFRDVLVRVDDFPRRAVGLMSAPVAARAAQVAESERASRAHASVISHETTQRQRNFLRAQIQFKIRLFIMSTWDKSSLLGGNDLQNILFFAQVSCSFFCQYYCTVKSPVLDYSQCWVNTLLNDLQPLDLGNVFLKWFHIK